MELLKERISHKELSAPDSMWKLAYKCSEERPEAGDSGRGLVFGERVAVGKFQVFLVSGLRPGLFGLRPAGP